MTKTSVENSSYRSLPCIIFMFIMALLVFECEVKEIRKSTTAKVPNEPERDRKSQTVSMSADDGNYCSTQGCADAVSAVLRNMNTSVDPCDDFYKYACGGFIEEAIIRDDEISNDTFSIVNDRLLEQLKTSFESVIKQNEPRAFRLVKKFYKLCMDMATIEKQGIKPLEKVLKKLGGWPVLIGDSWQEDAFDWIDSIYKFQDAGLSFDQFIEIRVDVDSKNSVKRVIHLDQAFLALSRSYMLKGFNDKVVSAYYTYIVDVAVILGADKDRAMKELKDSLTFEMEMANISLPEEQLRNERKMYNPMSVRQLIKKYPSVPWKKFFSKLLPSPITIEEDEVIIVDVPRYITGLVKLIARTPKRVQANYAMTRVACSSVAFLNDDLRNVQSTFFATLTGTSGRGSRAEECVTMVSSNLAIGTGALYVRKYFSKAAKENAVKMVTDIREQFNKTLEQVEWMDEETRERALEKAGAMVSKIAYADEMMDNNIIDAFYENLDLSGDNYLESFLDVQRFYSEFLFSQLRQPVNKTDWRSGFMPAEVNADYSNTENALIFPAGILQGAFFNNDRPRYMNYGAIGFIIGHEITHGFDDQGSQFDKNGNLQNWWAPSTRAKYLKRVRCIISQYENYTVPEVGLKLNGVNTQGENIADNGGIKIAYYAYKNHVARDEPDTKLRGINWSPGQMFWISAANVWCSKERPEALRNDVITDVHSTAELRVLGPFSNMLEFSKDFQCPKGSKMNPKKKCAVW